MLALQVLERGVDEADAPTVDVVAQRKLDGAALAVEVERRPLQSRVESEGALKANRAVRCDAHASAPTTSCSSSSFTPGQMPEKSAFRIERVLVKPLALSVDANESCNGIEASKSTW